MALNDAHMLNFGTTVVKYICGKECSRILILIKAQLKRKFNRERETLTSTLDLNLETELSKCS